MPIFEYHCPKCDQDFEKIVFNDKAKVQCPKCNSGKVTKKVSAFSFKSGSRCGRFFKSGGMQRLFQPPLRHLPLILFESLAQRKPWRE